MKWRILLYVAAAIIGLLLLAWLGSPSMALLGATGLGAGGALAAQRRNRNREIVEQAKKDVADAGKVLEDINQRMPGLVPETVADDVEAVADLPLLPHEPTPPGRRYRSPALEVIKGGEPQPALVADALGSMSAAELVLNVNSKGLADRARRIRSDARKSEGRGKGGGRIKSGRRRKR